VPIVSVSGACSRAGKTALAETLLRALPPRTAAAVKFTTTEEVFERCPRGSRCVVCDIDVPFRVITDPAVLAEAGTDTRRLADAGARVVAWAIARESAAPAAWAAVERAIEPGAVAVLEGSTVVERGLARPALKLFVAHRSTPPERWKPTSAALVAAADRVIVHSGGGAVAPAVLQGLAAFGARAPLVADVTRPLRDWAPDLAIRLAALAGAPALVDAAR
jgi:hypothetical protein